MVCATLAMPFGAVIWTIRARPTSTSHVTGVLCQHCTAAPNGWRPALRAVLYGTSGLVPSVALGVLVLPSLNRPASSRRGAILQLLSLIAASKVYTSGLARLFCRGCPAITSAVSLSSFLLGWASGTPPKLSKSTCPCTMLIIPPSIHGGPHNGEVHTMSWASSLSRYRMASPFHKGYRSTRVVRF